MTNKALSVEAATGYQPEQVHNPVFFFIELSTLQKENPELFAQKTSTSEFIQEIQEKLQAISTTQLVDVCNNNQDFQTFLIQVVFLQQEDVLYREGTGRKSIQGTWSDKLMSLVGSLDGKNILTGVLNHQGDPVRTKVDTHNKAAEASEILAIHADYLDGKEQSIAKVMAEVADGVYNLTQLLALDPDAETQEKYEKYLAELDDIYGVPRTHLLSLTIAKYHHRMYVSKDGQNAHHSEDQRVLQVVSKQFPQLIESLTVARKTINDSFKHFDKIFVKLRGILMKKFIKSYDTLDPNSQAIILKMLDENIAILRLFSEDVTLNATIIEWLSQEN